MGIEEELLQTMNSHSKKLNELLDALFGQIKENISLKAKMEELT